MKATLSAVEVPAGAYIITGVLLLVACVCYARAVPKPTAEEGGRFFLPTPSALNPIGDRR